MYALCNILCLSLGLNLSLALTVIVIESLKNTKYEIEDAVSTQFGKKSNSQVFSPVLKQVN